VSKVIVGTVFIIKIKVLETHHLVEFNPFRQKTRSVLEF